MDVHLFYITIEYGVFMACTSTTVTVGDVLQYREYRVALHEAFSKHTLEEFLLMDWHQIRDYFSTNREAISLVGRKIESFAEKETPLLSKIEAAWKKVLGAVEQDNDMRDFVLARFFELGVYDQSMLAIMNPPAQSVGCASVPCPKD